MYWSLLSVDRTLPWSSILLFSDLLIMPITNLFLMPSTEDNTSRNLLIIHFTGLMILPSSDRWSCCPVTCWSCILRTCFSCHQQRNSLLLLVCWSFTSLTCWSYPVLILLYSDLLIMPVTNGFLCHQWRNSLLILLICCSFTLRPVDNATTNLSLIPSMEVLISPFYLMIIHLTDLLIMPSAVASVILFSLKMGICSPMALKSPIIVAILRPCPPTSFPERSPSDIFTQTVTYRTFQ